MNRLALLLPLLAVAACRDNGASVQIQGICAPPTSCTFSAKCDAFALGNPRLDPAANQRLALYLQLENQLPDTSNKDTNRLNTNDAHVDEAVIEYGGLLGGRIVLAAQDYVPAAGTSVIKIEIIPAAVGSTLAASTTYPQYTLVTATLKLRGYYDDGSRFETAGFPVSVEIATGAGVTCPAGSGYCPPRGEGMYPATCVTGT